LSTAASPAPRRGLGRGLEVLIGGATSASELTQIPVGSIRPNTRQPRRRFDGASIDELAESVRAQGLVQPVVVRPVPEGGYELIVGERRWRAARVAGLATVPALVRETDDRDALLLALVENVAREDLSPVDEARAYAGLMDEFGLSLGEVAEHVGRSKPTISNRVRLLELPDDLLGLLERGQLTEGHARAVLSVPDNDDRRRLARRIVRQGLSVRAAERAARWAGARAKPRRKQPVDPALAERARGVVRHLTGAEAKAAAGRLEIYFADEVELEEIVEALERASLQSAGAGD
jgi:ParB family transcriptional regulator, chromosome partitioning protein